MSKSIPRVYLEKVKSLLNDTNTNIIALSNALIDKGILDSSFKDKKCTAGDIISALAKYDNQNPIMMNETEEAEVIAQFDDTGASGAAIKTNVIAEMPLKGYGKDGITYIDPTDITKIYNSVNNTTLATDRADGDTSIKRWTSRSIFKFLDIYYKYDRRKYEIPIKELRNGLFLRKANDPDGIVDVNGLKAYPYPEEIVMISENKESNFIHFINVQYTDAHYGHFNGRNYNFMIVKDRERYGVLNDEGTEFKKYLSVYANDVDTELAYIDKKEDDEWYLNIPVPDKVYGEELIDSMWDVRIIWRKDAPDRSFSLRYDLEIQETNWMEVTQGTLPVSGSWYAFCYGKDKFVSLSYNTSTFVYSTDGITWTKGTLPVKGTWYSVCYGKDKFVALSYNTSTFVYSTDGISWTQGTLPVSGQWYAVCYGKDKFVSLRSNIFVYSTDGISWTQGTLLVSGSWFALCYGKDKFVALSYNTSTFVYSTDGISWTQGTLPVSGQWYAVCYGKDKFVSLSADSSTFVYSTDGITWTQGTLPVSSWWYSVCYAKDKFVSLASDSSTFVYSTDGISWTQGTLPVSGQWYAVCYGNGRYVSLANKTFVAIQSNDISALDFDILDDRIHLINSTTENVANTRNQITKYSEYSGKKNILYEPFLLNEDGNIVSGSNFENENKLVEIEWKSENTWTQGTLPISGSWYGVCYGKDKFVSLASGSSTFVYSTDGITWTQGTLPVKGSWYGVCYGKDKFVSLNFDGTTSFIYSTNGITWTQGTLPVSGYWESICYGKDKFVAPYYRTSTFIYSTNGITWTQGTLPVKGNWRSICYGNGMFVSLTDGSYDSTTFVYSTDGITWTQGTLPVSGYWKSVCYGNGMFVSLNYDGGTTFIYSTDGITWTQGTLPVSRAWRCVGYGKSKFIALSINASSSTFVYSIDGITWTQGTLSIKGNAFSLCYGKDKFVLLCSSNIFAYSMDTILNLSQIPNNLYKISPDSPVLANHYIGFSYRSDLNNNRGLSTGFGSSNIPTTTNNIYAIIYDKKLNYQYNVNLTENIGSIASVLNIELLQNKIYYNEEKSVYCLPILITTINALLYTNIPIKNNELIPIPSINWGTFTTSFDQVNYQINDLGYIKNTSDNKYYKVNWLISNYRLSKYSIEKTASDHNYYNQTVDIPMSKFPLLFGRDKMISLQGSSISNITKTIYDYDTSQVSLSTIPDYPNIVQQKRNYAILKDTNGDMYIVKLIEKYIFNKSLSGDEHDSLPS